MKGMGAVAAAAKFKSKAKKSKSSSGWIKRASTSAEIDASVSPLAAAITQEENEGALVLLREAGLGSVRADTHGSKLDKKSWRSWTCTDLSWRVSSV
jgi:hypothetical protein